MWAYLKCRNSKFSLKQLYVIGVKKKTQGQQVSDFIEYYIFFFCIAYFVDIIRRYVPVCMVT